MTATIGKDKYIKLKTNISWVYVAFSPTINSKWDEE